MSKNLTTEQKLVIAKRVIFALGIVSTTAVIFFFKAMGFFSNAEVLFHREVTTEDAIAHIDEFRNDWEFRRRTKVIWYDPSDIQKYLDVTFNDWKSKMPLPIDSKWGIGFYPMRRSDNKGRNRVDFLVIPTILNEKDSSVLDFRDDNVRAKYYNLATTRVNGLCSDCPGYDAGHLWP